MNHTDPMGGEIRALTDAELDMVDGAFIKEAINRVIEVVKDVIDAIDFEIKFMNILVGPDPK